MDRRGHYRPLLNRIRLAAAGCLLTMGWLTVASTARAQQESGVNPPTPSVSVPPDAALRKRAAERMAERRQRELAAGDPEAQRRIDQLPPEEREAFKRNLRVWRQLTPEERDVVRREAGDRTRAEVERAYQQSGLHLDKDQREVFGLRYRQERRKLERALQEKLEAERARQLPARVEGLKKEFADKSGTSPAPIGTTSPTLTPIARPTPSVSVPAASASVR